MAVFLVAHGAWSAGWAWKKMRPLLRAAGHDLLTPTYTGLGERAHLRRPPSTSTPTSRDVLGVIEMEDLRELVLIGHSYGGMVATGVADRVRDRIAQLIYLDAFVPGDGQSSFDLQGPEARERMRQLAQTAGEGWRIPPNPMPPDTRRGRPRLGGRAPGAAADQDLRATAAHDLPAAAAAAHLHLLPARPARRRFPPVRRARPA